MSLKTTIAAMAATLIVGGCVSRADPGPTADQPMLTACLAQASATPVATPSNTANTATVTATVSQLDTISATGPIPFDMASCPPQGQQQAMRFAVANGQATVHIEYSGRHAYGISDPGTHFSQFTIDDTFAVQPATTTTRTVDGHAYTVVMH